MAFEICAYSVPWQHAYKQAVLKAYVDRLEIWVDHQLVARHERSYERNQSVLELDHYLDVFLRKPGALQYAIPFKQALLPEPYHHLHAALRRAHPRSGDREFVKVLLLHREHPAEDVLSAVTEATERCSPNVDTIRTLLAMRQLAAVTPPALDLTQHAGLPTVEVPPVMVDRYNRLLGKGGVVH